MTVISESLREDAGREIKKNDAGVFSATEGGMSEREIARRNIRTVARLERAALSERSQIDCVVDSITAFCGTMTFVYVHAIWFGGWILWDMLPMIPKSLRFDPFPFSLLTLVVSLEAIFLSTFILISQNRQGHLAERRNNLDLQINILAEQESTKTLVLVESIAQHLGIAVEDPELAGMLEQTHPEHLVEEIETIIEQGEADLRQERREERQRQHPSRPLP